MSIKLEKFCDLGVIGILTLYIVDSKMNTYLRGITTNMERCEHMGYEKLVSMSLTEQFIQRIEDMILSGELSCGEQLPPARELAARMGVSRPVVTAGLIELEKLGFVEIRSRQGAFVCDYRRKGTVETLVAIMRYNGGILRARELTSLLQVRRVLEKLCMEQVLDNASDAQLRALSPLVEAIGTAGTGEDCAEAVFRFHHELAVLSGNVLLPLLYHSFKAESVQLWQYYANWNGIRALYEIKLELYRALLNRDRAAATREPGEYPDEIWWQQNLSALTNG